MNKVRLDGVRRISQLSNVHRGTAFEERSLSLLQDHFSMALRRVGGKSDGGIDLQGWWWVPQLWKPLDPLAVDELSQRRRIRVLAQCKAERKKFSPNYVREMEGVLYRHMATTPTTHASQPSLNDTHLFSYPSIALLVSESAFTKSTLLRAFSSTVPFFLLHLPQQASNDIQHKGDSVALGSAFWNPALSGESGILGGEMEIRWERSLSGGGRPGMWWRGEKVRNWTPESGFVQDDNISFE